MKFTQIAFVSVLVSSIGFLSAGCKSKSSATPDGGSPATCNSVLFDNGNSLACTDLTDTSVFTLSSTSTVTALRLWVNTSVSGESVSYKLLGPTGTLLSSGATTKTGCDPYQKNWCEFKASMNITLAAGTYTVKSSATATCSNSGSNYVGFVSVSGCGGAATTLDAGCPYGGAKYGGGCADAPASTCNNVLFDNGNTAACTNPTDTSVFTLSATSTVTSLRLWVNTTISGQSISYTLLGPTGTTLSSGPTTKGGCDPYQTNWCEFLVSMNMSLAAGTYTVKSSAKATCANSGSNNVGMVTVRGCAGVSTTPDAGTGTCSSVLFDNGNTAACTNPTDTSVFTLSATSTVTSLRLWVNTTISGQSISYTLLGPTGTMLSSGPTTKGGCDPYQTNWCEFLVSMNMTLPAGSYTVKSSAKATCSNSGSNNVGMVTVKGCAGVSTTPDAGCPYGGAKYGGGCADAPAATTCNTVLFDNGNIAACTNPTDTSVFTLSATSTVTSLRLWVNTTISGQSVTYSLLGPTGTTLSSGPTTKGGCDPYQTNWCEFLVSMNMTLPAGSYTVKSSAKATCSNSGSNNVGFVLVKGCAGVSTTPDAGCPYGGAKYGGGCADAPAATTCNTVLFDNGNIAACTNPTDTSVFTLSATSTVTSLRLWVDTTISGQSVTYSLLGPTGTTLSSGPTTKGGCDPYQTNWCEFLVSMNMTLPAGSYTVKSSAKATCSNSGSNNIGFVAVKGCAGTVSATPDAGALTCSTVLFDNGNIAACTNPTDTSVFTLSATSTVTSLRLWVDTTISGQSVTYSLLGPTGTTLSSGPTTKGGCDPYQTNWCEFLVSMNMTLPAGSYTVKSSVKATCSNSGSNNIGFVAVKGCTSGTSPDAGAGSADTRAQPDAGAPDAGPTYFTVSTPPVGMVAPAGAKNSALKTTTYFGVGGIFWKDGRLFATSNLGGPIVSVMPGETGTLWAPGIASLSGGSPSWRHGVPLTGGNVLIAIDYYGGPTGLHEISSKGDDLPWTLAQGHSGIGDIVALSTGGWAFSDFESYNIFKVSAKNSPETALITAGTFTPAFLAHDATTDTLYFANMKNLGSEPWFAGDGAIYKVTTSAPVLVANPPSGGRFTGLAVGLGGLFPAGLYATDSVNSQVSRVESTGTLTPVVTGVPTPIEPRIDPVSKGMALFSADRVVFILP